MNKIIASVTVIGALAASLATYNSVASSAPTV